MKKPRKKDAEPIRWSVFMMRSKATLLGSVEALDEKKALAKAIKELHIRPVDRWRLNVWRE